MYFQQLSQKQQKACSIWCTVVHCDKDSVDSIVFISVYNGTLIAWYITEGGNEAAIENADNTEEIMAKSKWNTNRKETDTVAISDGTLTYYANFDLDIYDMSEVVEDFSDSYDHNDVDGDVRCIARRLDTGAELRFNC